MSDIIKYKDLNINDIIFTELKDSDRISSQKISYIRYKKNGEDFPLKIQTPEFCYEAGGIPREGQYYPDSKSRSFYKLAFCHDRCLNPNINYEQIELFYNKLKDIDDYCDTDEFRKQKHIFGEKNYNQYSYQRIIRVPEVDEEEPKVDKNGKPYYQPPFTKIKLELEYEEDQDNPKNIPKFSIFEKIDDKRVKIELKSFEDVEKFIVWQSKVRFIISFSKLYAMKTKSGKEKKGYGIILKATCIEVQRPASATKNQSTNDAFVDSDDEDNVQNKNNQPTITRNNLDIEDNEDDESEIIKQVVIDDDEEVIEEPKAKSKAKSKSKSKNP
jgi:hypothetical protein